MPLLGATVTEARFTTITQWMSNGNIRQFTKARAGVNGLELVGVLFELLVLPLMIIPWV